MILHHLLHPALDWDLLLTTRGLKENDFKILGDLISDVICGFKNNISNNEIENEVNKDNWYLKNILFTKFKLRIFMRCPLRTDDTQVKDQEVVKMEFHKERRLCSSWISFYTFERIQLRELVVVKEMVKSIFDREKIVKSMEIALRKRKVDNDVVERAQNGIVRQLESLEKLKFNQI